MANRTANDVYGSRGTTASGTAKTAQAAGLNVASAGANAIKTLGNALTSNTGSSGGSYSGGGSGSGTGTDYATELYNMFQSENEKARDQMLRAIELQLEATKNAYNKSMQNTGDEYDKLIDQNEVKKARARRLMRENQANLGIGDSGLGRWDKANLDLSYDATSGNLHKAKQQAIDEITNLITQAEAEAENNRANVNNAYSNALMQWRLANL